MEVTNEVAAEFLGRLLLEKEKLAVLDPSYEGPQEKLNVLSYYVGYITKHISRHMDKRSLYGTKKGAIAIEESGLLDEVCNATFDIDGDSDFPWDSSNTEVMNLILSALEDPAFRVIFEALIFAYKESICSKSFDSGSS